MLAATRSSSVQAVQAGRTTRLSSVRPVCRAFSSTSGSAASRRQQSSSSGAQQQPRMVQARFFRFGKNGFGAEDAGIVGSQGRDDYNYDDVEQYFNYMGFLATEGTYDRMEAMLKSGLHPIDVILLLACSENDTPKVGEILKAGANVRVKGLDGKTPSQLATKPELLSLLKEYEAKATASV